MDMPCALQPWASLAGTVLHGRSLELHRPHYDAGRYLVFLGRMAAEAPGCALAVGLRLPLKAVAKVGPWG